MLVYLEIIFVLDLGSLAWSYWVAVPCTQPTEAVS